MFRTFSDGYISRNASKHKCKVPKTSLRSSTCYDIAPLIEHNATMSKYGASYMEAFSYTDSQSIRDLSNLERKYKLWRPALLRSQTTRTDETRQVRLQSGSDCVPRTCSLQYCVRRDEPVERLYSHFSENEIRNIGERTGNGSLTSSKISGETIRTISLKRRCVSDAPGSQHSLKELFQKIIRSHQDLDRVVLSRRRDLIGFASKSVAANILGRKLQVVLQEPSGSRVKQELVTCDYNDPEDQIFKTAEDYKELNEDMVERTYLMKSVEDGGEEDETPTRKVSLLN